MTPDMISKPLDAGAQYGSAGPFIVVVLIFVTFLVIAGWGMFRYLGKLQEQHAKTVESVVADVKASTQMMTDTVRQCSANQMRHK